MMGIGPTEAGSLDLWTYEALLYNWNEAHSTDEDAPEPERAMRILEAIGADPRLIH